MVNIHGGGLYMGSAADLELEALAIAGDIVHVAINYRLNVFGFLATPDMSTPGNVAYLDQVGLQGFPLNWNRTNSSTAVLAYEHWVKAYICYLLSGNGVTMGQGKHC